MTSRTRQYIELQDLLGLRFECKHCETSVEVSFNHLTDLPSQCSNCGQTWMAKPQGDMSASQTYSRLGQFVSAYKAMTAELEGQYAIAKFSLSLEITAISMGK